MWWLIAFVGLVVTVVGVIGVIRPMAALYLPTRGHAALAVFLGLMILSIGAVQDQRASSQRQTSPPGDVSPKQAGSGSTNRAHLALMNSSQEERAQALRNAVTSAGENCDDVTRTFHQGAERRSGDEMWNVECRNGNSFAISVKNDVTGSTRVLSCAVLKAVAQVKCFLKY